MRRPKGDAGSGAKTIVHGGGCLPRRTAPAAGAFRHGHSLPVRSRSAKQTERTDLDHLPEVPQAERGRRAGGRVPASLLVLQEGMRLGVLATAGPVAVPEVQGADDLGELPPVVRLLQVRAPRPARCTSCRLTWPTGLRKPRPPFFPFGRLTLPRRTAPFREPCGTFGRLTFVTRRQPAGRVTGDAVQTSPPRKVRREAEIRLKAAGGDGCGWCRGSFREPNMIAPTGNNRTYSQTLFATSLCLP